MMLCLSESWWPWIYAASGALALAVVWRALVRLQLSKAKHPSLLTNTSLP